jgi:hypothetical protein
MTALEGATPQIVSRFAAVLKHADVHAELERLFQSRWPTHPTGEFDLQVLKAHRDRCTFELSLDSEDRERSVIAKVYAVDRVDVFSAMESIVAGGFGPAAENAIPPPLAYLPSHHVLIEEKVHGPQAMEIFMTDDSVKHLSTAQRCGQWLGRFHMEAPRQGHLAEPKELLVSLRYWADKIQGAGDPLASKAALLLRKLETALPAVVHGFEPRAGHGSFMPEHVVVNGERTVTIDLDEYDTADPARDLAWFIVSLERLGLKKQGSLRVHDRSLEAFLRAYVGSGPRNALSHLSFYKAAECLHRAHRDLYKRIPPVPEWAEMMLDEGIDALGWVRANRDEPRPFDQESHVTRPIRGRPRPHRDL